MNIGRTQNDPITIDGEALEIVDHFKYLGSIKSSDGTCTKDIIARIGMAKQWLIQLNNIWKDRAITTTLKLKILKTLIWPVMLYGCEGWTIRNKNEKIINAAEMWCYRRLLRISWIEKRSNKSILEQLNTNTELLNTIKSRKLKYFGHAIRHQNCNIMKNVAQGTIEGNRRRGRPTISYMNNITKWTQLSPKEVFCVCEDRDKWRRISRCVLGSNHHSW